MKRICVFFLALLLSLNIFSQMTGGGGGVVQKSKPASSGTYSDLATVSLSLSNLVVLEYEKIVQGNIGVSLGIMPLGAEIAARYYLKPDIYSSAIGFRTAVDYSYLSDRTAKPRFGAFYQIRAWKYVALKLEAGIGNFIYEEWDSYDHDYYDIELFKAYFEIRIGGFIPW